MAHAEPAADASRDRKHQELIPMVPLRTPRKSPRLKRLYELPPA